MRNTILTGLAALLMSMTGPPHTKAQGTPSQDCFYEPDSPTCRAARLLQQSQPAQRPRPQVVPTPNPGRVLICLSQTRGDFYRQNPGGYVVDPNC
jgi:hypothetical protein